MKNNVNFNKILAENMLRFGTKNLTESIDKLKLLVEAAFDTSRLENIDTSKLTISDEDKANIDENNKDMFSKTLQKIKENGIIASVPQTDIAYKIVNLLGDRSFNYFKYNNYDVKLNRSDQDPAKILTHGNITPNGVSDPDDFSGASSYVDIAKYYNNLALQQLADGEQGGVSLTTDQNGSLAPVAPTANHSYFWGTTSTTAAKSQQQVKETVWVVPATGKTIEKNIPGSMFETGEVTLADSTEVDKAIAELSSLAQDKNIKITGITIQSSASGDRGVGGKSGYPKEADLAAKKYPLGTPYRPKSSSESGNAALAFGRAKTIQAKLGNIAPVTVDAMIQNGGDAAQYAKIIATIEKVDQPAQELSKKELTDILLVPKKTEDLSAIATLKLFKAIR